MERLLPCLAFLTGLFPPLSIAGASAALALFAAAAPVAALSRRSDFRPVKSPFDAPVLAFMAVWLLASLTGLAPAKSLGKVFSQTHFIAFFLLLWSRGGRCRPAALRGYLWGAGLAAAYGGLQLLAARLDFQGRAPSLFALLDGADAYVGLRDSRIHGAVHPLTYAEVLLPSFLLGAAYFLEAEGRRKVLAGAAWVLALGGAVLLSQSRGPCLGAAAGAALLFLCHRRRKRLLLPFLLIGTLAAFHPAVRDRVTRLAARQKNESDYHRLILWNNAWQVARSNLWTGVGPRCLAEAVERHAGEPGFLPNPLKQDGDAHNQFLHHLAERGLPGLGVLVWVMGTAIAAAVRAVRRADEDFPPRWVRWGLLAFFAAFPVINLTERVFDDAEPALVFWVLASLLVRTAGGGAGGSGPARSGGAPRT